MEIFKQPERLSAPICAKCGIAMTWIHSALIKAERTVLHKFTCQNCGNSSQIRTPAKLAKE
ncbi:hypothetical protein Q2941_31690 [Bradyrhizobium sp. UFLA05-153]